MNNKIQLSTSVETITPEIAKVYLSMNGANRPFKPRTVDFYADQMKRGLWKENGEAICFTSDGKLADGQHRLSAVIKSGCTIRFVVVRGCEEGSFATYDSGVNRRSSDVFAIAHVRNYVQKSAIVGRYFTICRRARFVSGRGRGDTQSRSRETYISLQDKLSEYQTHSDVFDWASKAAERCRDRLNLFTNAEIGGTMSYLVIKGQFSEGYVERFFNALHDVRENWNSAIFAFRRTLIRDLGKSTGTMTGAHKQALLIKTWNAYATGSEFKRMSYDPEKEGKVWFLTREEAEKANTSKNIKRGAGTAQGTQLFAQ